jgi:hypothetical protein
MENKNPYEETTASILNISLTVQPSLLQEFSVLLQTGFTIKCVVGTSLEKLFYEQLKLNLQVVEEKISTIFLNGKPVDDITTAIVQDGSVLALSGAMPGLVGATLRRKSPLASFRQSISAEQASKKLKKTEGFIQIKLFNILLKELGPFFLEMGIFLQGSTFTSFIAEQTDDFFNQCVQIVVNGKPVKLQSLAEWHSLLSNYDFIHLNAAVK